MKVFKDVLTEAELFSDGMLTKDKYDSDLASSSAAEAKFGKMMTKATGSKYWYDNENMERLSDQDYADKEDKSQCVEHVDIINGYNLKRTREDAR